MIRKNKKFHFYCLYRSIIFLAILQQKNCKDLYYFELRRNDSSQRIFLVFFFRPKMDDWPKAVKVHFESDPVVEFLRKIETIHLPIVPLYIFMYVSELYVFLRAFAKTFKEKACTKAYCRENRRTMMMIKFIWLVFLPLLLITTPRRLCLFQAVILALISIALYISALTKKASCRSALLTTTVSELT